MGLSFGGRLVAWRGDILQQYGATRYHPLLSCWDGTMPFSCWKPGDHGRSAGIRDTPPAWRGPRILGPHAQDDKRGTTLICHVGSATWKVLRREPSAARPVWTAWTCGAESR